MKSEHRHELQTNELGKFAERVAVYVDQHGNRLMVVICAAALVLAGGIYWMRSQSSSRTAAWSELSSAIGSGTPEMFNSVWVDHKGTVPGLWARVHEGEARLGQGVQAMFRNVEAGTSDLEKARDAFQDVVGDRGAPLELRERALFGLGRALESLSAGSEDEAVKAYESFVKEFPKSEFAADAKARIEVLKSGRGQEFYAWFSKFPRPKMPDKLPRDRGSDEDVMNDLKDILDSTTKDGTKASDDEKLTLPEEMEEGDRKNADEPDAKRDAKPAKTDGKAEQEPRPEPPSEPETKPE